MFTITQQRVLCKVDIIMCLQHSRNVCVSSLRKKFSLTHSSSTIYNIIHIEIHASHRCYDQSKTCLASFMYIGNTILVRLYTPIRYIRYHHCQERAVTKELVTFIRALLRMSS